MNRLTLLTAVALLPLATGGCASNDSASADAAPSQPKTVSLGMSGAHGDDGDVVVTFDDCPIDVQATILAHLHGGAINEIERTTDHGEVLYEVDVATEDGMLEFDVAENGAFRGYEDDGEDVDDAWGDNDDSEDEGDADDDVSDDDADDDDDGDDQEIPLSEVPDHVKAAAADAVPGIILEEAEIEHEGDTVVYGLEGEANGVEYEIEVSADGEVLEVEVDDEDSGSEDDDGPDDD